MRILVVITGASGILYGKRLVDILKTKYMNGNEITVIVSDSAKKVATVDGTNIPHSDYSEDDFNCPCASGSGVPDIMVVCPCSLKTLGEIANGIGNNIITRSAEVILKERKKLIIVPRETPYSYITIKNMEKITLAGGIILPASPGFYHSPKNIKDLVDFIVGKVLDQMNIEHNLYKKWKGKDK